MDRSAIENSVVLLVLLLGFGGHTIDAALFASCNGKTLLRSGELNCKQRRLILDAHNQARQQVALGMVPGQPEAAAMLEMSWDDELAVVAQRWADRCLPGHDNARDVRRFKVGQNIAVTWTTNPHITPEPDFPYQIHAWFNEVRLFAYKSSGFSKSTGHYSQIVWAETFLVGCGYSFYYDPARGYTKLYVCNYGPGGNVVGSRPYQAGHHSCRRRGYGPSLRFPGLCEVPGYSTLGRSCSFTPNYGYYG